MTHASAHRSTRRRSLPASWEDIREEDGYEYVPLHLPRELSRVTASMRLAIQAEYGGWELSRVRAYTDGSRRVLLRRKVTTSPDRIVPEAGI